jgi:hypothetical protein
LGPCHSRKSRECRNAGGEMQKTATLKLHGGKLAHGHQRRKRR